MITRFRAPVAKGVQESAPAAEGSKPRVDREAGIIYGASAMQAVEALGHGVDIDATTLEQVAALGNAQANGVKVRFTHPGACSDGMGRMLGRQRNFRVQGDKVVGDIHLMESAARSPEGDLRSYVLDLAEEDPAAFGMSVVVEATHAWKLQDGGEVEVGQRPAKAVGDRPFLRVKALRASDIVDEPAANRDGLFAEAFAATTNEDAAEAFAALDALRERLGLSPERAHEFLARYFAARGIQPAGTRPASPHKGSSMTPEQLKALKGKHPDHAGLIVDMFADGKGEAEILAAIQDAQIASLRERNAALAGEIKTNAEAHAKALAAKDEQIAALTKERDGLAKLGEKAPADPGAQPAAGGDEIEKRWAAMSEAGKSEWFNDIEVFREAERMRKADLHTKKEA